MRFEMEADKVPERDWLGTPLPLEIEEEED